MSAVRSPPTAPRVPIVISVELVETSTNSPCVSKKDHHCQALEEGKHQQADKNRRGKPPKASTWTLSKSDSFGSITEYIVRSKKRDRTIISPTDSEESVASPGSNRHTIEQEPKNTVEKQNKRKKTNGNQGYKIETANMAKNSTPKTTEDMFQMILEKMDEQKAALSHEIKNSIAELSTEMCKMENEIENLKKKIEEPRVGGKENYKELTECKRQLENHARQLNRNNIIISGLNIEPERCFEETRTFIENKFKAGSCVQEVHQIGKGRKDLLVKITSAHAKDHIMKNKNTLKSTNIFIGNDLTAKEREIAYKARDIVRKERQKGNVAKSGYMKIMINEEWRYWNEEAEDFVARSRRSRGPTMDLDPQRVEERINTAPPHVNRARKKEE